MEFGVWAQPSMQKSTWSPRSTAGNRLQVAMLMVIGMEKVTVLTVIGMEKVTVLEIPAASASLQVCNGRERDCYNDGGRGGGCGGGDGGGSIDGGSYDDDDGDKVIGVALP